VPWRQDVLLWCLVFCRWCVVLKDEICIELEERNPTPTFTERKEKVSRLFSTGPDTLWCRGTYKFVVGLVFCRVITPCLCLRFFSNPTSTLMCDVRIAVGYCLNSTFVQWSLGIPCVTVKGLWTFFVVLGHMKFVLGSQCANPHRPGHLDWLLVQKNLSSNLKPF
jgi:hypothetical protein